MSRALILVGHGSHLNGDSSAPVYAHAAAIRRTGLFDEVIEAFWKEEPALPDAIALAESDEIFVVPLFLAEGYFTREVLPRELGLEGPLTQRDGQTIHYLPPVGAHPAMAGMILERAIRDSGLSAPERPRAALIVIGHGTERSATSGDTLYALLDDIRAQGDFGRVDCGFLDESPRIADVIEGATNREIVLVPFFMAEGWHTRQTIPTDLGLTGPVTNRAGKTLWYTPPVGTLPELADVVIEMTRPLLDGRADRQPVTVSPAAGARIAFLEWMGGGQHGQREFLQLALRTGPDGTFSLRHRLDNGRSEDGLRHLSGPAELLELVRTASGGAYRPIRSSADLPDGWIYRAATPDDFWRALSIIYPAAVSYWHRERATTLAATSYEAWAGRQTAMYEVVRGARPEQLHAVVASLCTGCLRTRRWRSAAESVAELHDPPGDPDMAIVPCCEPCSLFATRVRELIVAPSSGR